MVFDARWLDHPIAGADPAAYSAIIDTIKEVEAKERASFAAQVRRAIHAMLFSASASSVSLANLFNLHERTLRRRLEAEGETVRNLVSEVRQEMADHLLRDTLLPVSEIAAVLRYSDATVFSCAFRSRSHMSPSEWRAQHGKRPLPGNVAGASDRRELAACSLEMPSNASLLRAGHRTFRLRTATPVRDPFPTFVLFEGGHSGA